jgi:hypothetical protein
MAINETDGQRVVGIMNVWVLGEAVLVLRHSASMPTANARFCPPRFRSGTVVST